MTAMAEPMRAKPRMGKGAIASLVVLAFISLFYIYPFLMQVATSFKTDNESTASPLSLIPQTWTFDAYDRLFRQSAYPTWFANSVLVTILVTAGRVFFNSLAGYALARLRFPGRQLIFLMLIAVMAVPGVVLLIPKFLVIKQLGIYDSYAALVLPLLVDAAGVFIMKNFFESIPQAVEEAARIDGAGTFRTFWSIVLPMARPALITITILSFQGSWNEYSHFIIASQDPALYTLAKGVGSLTGGGLGTGNQFPLKLAAAAIMTIPVAVLFFAFQRQIMNTTGGAVKD